MLDALRFRAYEALRSTAGNQLLPVRVTRGVLTFINDMVGRPLAPEDEIAERKRYEEHRRQRIAETEAKRAAEAAEDAAAARKKSGAAAKREAAPVVIYLDAQSHRDLKRIKDVLRGREIACQELSIVEDEATRSWVETTAKTKEFPVVFIAGQPIGGYDDVVQLDVKGELVKLVFGA
jgi:glutaredoxin